MYSSVLFNPTYPIFSAFCLASISSWTDLNDLLRASLSVFTSIFVTLLLLCCFQSSIPQLIGILLHFIIFLLRRSYWVRMQSPLCFFFSRRHAPLSSCAINYSWRTLIEPFLPFFFLVVHWWRKFLSKSISGRLTSTLPRWILEEIYPR